MNQWFYAANGEQRGPVDDAVLDALIASGEVVATSLVWRNGMADWAPLSQARPSATGVPPPVSAPRCAGCGGTFADEELVRVQGRPCCAACKPVMLQKLQEGVPFGAVETAMVSEAEVIARDYRVEAIGDLQRAWRTVADNPASVLLGAMLLGVVAIVVLFAGNMVGTVLQLALTAVLGVAGVVVAVVVSSLLQCLLQGATVGGLWAFFCQHAAGARPGIEIGFSGWPPRRLVPLFFVNLWPSLIFFGVVAVFVLVAVGMMVLVLGWDLAAINEGMDELFRAASAWALASFLGLVVAMLAVIFYLQTCWMFAPALVVQKSMRAWPAMQLSRRVVGKRFWSTLRLMILALLLMFGLVGLMSMVAAVLPSALMGFLVFGAMILTVLAMPLTVPLVFLMFAHHFNRLFGDLEPRA